MSWLRYAGEKRFHIADGGSPQEHLDYYDKVLSGVPHTIEVTDNLSAMCNSCAKHGGDVWITMVDDYALRYPITITNDVSLLLEDASIGAIRMSRLAFWGSGGIGPETSADLVTVGACGNHWWKLDKSKTKDSYMSSIGVHIYHRRFWEAYGDIPRCPPNVPGEAELRGAERFREKSGSTIAVPMRFGQDADDFQEPFWHLGTWRTDEYAKVAGTRL